MPWALRQIRVYPDRIGTLFPSTRLHCPWTQSASAYPAQSAERGKSHTMARTAHFPHFQLQAGFPTLRRAGRGTALGALLYGLSFIGAAALRVVTPVVKGLYSGVIDAQQRRADRRIWEIAQSDPVLKAELIALREYAESKE